MSTGHGSKWGVATTRNDIMSVVVKSEVVIRDRGWRCGGMIDRTRWDVRFFRKSPEASLGAVFGVNGYSKLSR